MGDHDHSYKLLFAHPRMVRELLETFVGGNWLSEVNLDSLERVSDNYISDDLRARADDIVWRARCGDDYLYLLVEFQSRVDTFMALRVLAYVALLYQDILKAHKSARHEGLPAILPVVLHSGSKRWYAPKNLGSLLRPAPSEVEECKPNLRYVLVDESSYDDDTLARHDNLVSSLFRLEQCRDRERLRFLVGDLLRKLMDSGDESLFRAFAVWLEKVVLARLSRERMVINNLWEKRTMLSERFDEWEAELRQEGRQAGEAGLLTRQLMKRFGELPDAIRNRLSGAGTDELEHWGERLLDVSTLDELFAEAS